MRASAALILLCLAAAPRASAQYVISTVAGGVLPDNVPAWTVSFQPKALALDRAGNLYAADQYTVYRITPGGTLTVFAGTGAPGSQGDGKAATSASFTSIASLAADAAGSIYIADANNNRVRKVDAATGVISTVAGGGNNPGDGILATDAQLGGPAGLALDPAGGLYIAESYGQRVRRVDPATHNIAAVAGTGVAGSGGDGGPALQATLNGPQQLALDSQGNLYIAETYGFRVRKVNAISGTINTVAGTGNAGYNGDGRPPLLADLSDSINGLAVDAAGVLYISDGGNNRVRKVSADLGIINTVAGGATAGFNGDGAGAAQALLNSPGAIVASPDNVLLVADTGNNRVRAVDFNTGLISTTAGGGAAGDGGPATRAQLNKPARLAVDSAGNLYINDCGSGRIRRVNAAGGTISTVAGSGYPGYAGDAGPAASAQLQGCGGLSIESGGALYLADTGNYRVRRIDLVRGTIDTYAGTGDQGSTRSDTLAVHALLRPDSVAAAPPGNVYIADSRNNLVREVLAANGMLHNVAGTGTAGFSGDGGPAAAANLAAPNGVVADAAGNVYFTDTVNQRIRRIAAGTGVITTVAGTGVYGHAGDGGPAASAQIGNPMGIAIDAAGALYFVESAFGYVRRIAPDGTINTIAGGGTGGDGGAATDARLLLPSDVAVDGSGNIYVAEPALNRVRKLAVPGSSGLQILTSSLPAATVGLAYAQTLSASGGKAPYRTWTIIAGALPPGLSLDASAGVLSGTPGSDGTYAFTVQVTDDAGAKATKPLTLESRVPSVVITADGIRSAANLRAGPIAPGEMLQISGTGFGPAAADVAVAASGSLSTTLDGVRVYFDGFAAPVVSTAPGQVTVVAPFSLDGKTATAIQVEFNGNRSTLISIPVQPANPAIFTSDGSGGGQATVLNADGSPNSASNPAAPGSVVSLWATGAGQTNPPGTDGQIETAPLPRSVLPVSVTVGGRDAQVIYAGDAPSAVAGVVQLNVVLPADLTPVDALPIILHVGPYSSGPDATIAIAQPGNPAPAQSRLMAPDRGRSR